MRRITSGALALLWIAGCSDDAVDGATSSASVSAGVTSGSSATSTSTSGTTGSGGATSATSTTVVIADCTLRPWKMVGNAALMPPFGGADRPPQPDGSPAEDKIAAIGVRLRKWVSFHGIAFNVEPDLEHFSGITPCGISAPQFGVTSLVDLGLPVTMSDADAALRTSFERVFGATELAQPPA